MKLSREWEERWGFGIEGFQLEREKKEEKDEKIKKKEENTCLLYTSPSPRD